MTVVRAPLRLSFVGGGTDMAAFYERYPGRVISTAIDKFVHVAIDETPLSRISARYSVIETVDHPREFKHTRIKAALLDKGVVKGVEVVSFATLPVRTGLGSSSSFSVALLKAISVLQEKDLSAREIAEEACRLEIDILKEPIGKQDQYIAAFGGFNVLTFNPGGRVDVEPVKLSDKVKADFESQLLVFFTGITRDASSVLSEQKDKVADNFEVMKKMADSVYDFKDRLEKGNIKGLGEMLHEGWLRKKSLTSKVSNQFIDNVYNSGISAGAYGGKLLGAGGGGCLLFIVPPSKRKAVIEALTATADREGLVRYRDIPVKLFPSGVEVLCRSDYKNLF